MQDSIFIEKFEDIDLKSVKRSSKLSFYCEICNQLSEKHFYRLKVNRKLLCTKCLRAESIKNRTFEEKQKSIEKYKQSCLKHFGTEFPIQNKQIKNKIQQTCLERYNSKCVVGSKYAEEKKKQTCQQKYGKDYYLQTDLAQKK